MCHIACWRYRPDEGGVLVKSTIGRAVLSGYGGAIGRDAWRTTKKSASNTILLVLFLGALFGAIIFPFWGGRDIARWHNRGPVATFFLTLLFPAALFGLGIALGHLGDTWLQQFQGVKAPIHPRLDVILSVAGASFALGAIYGTTERGRRKARFLTERHNRLFLRLKGFRGEGEGEFRDADDNLLRVIDTTPDRITFLAVGRRNKRAYIRTAADGTMLAYSGVMPVQQPWDGSDMEDVEPLELDTPRQAPISDEVSFGGDVEEAEAKAAIRELPEAITVQRKKSSLLKAQTFQVLADGREVATLENYHQVIIDLPAYSVEIQVRCGPVTSNAIKTKDLNNEAILQAYPVRGTPENRKETAIILEQLH